MESSLVFFLVLLSFAFFVLYMVLFFKVWRMTDEIHEFKQQMNLPSIVNREICKGSDRVRDVLFDAMWNDLEKEAFCVNADFKPIIERYHSLYTRANIEFPAEVDKIKNSGDYWKYVKGKLEGGERADEQIVK